MHALALKSKKVQGIFGKTFLCWHNYIQLSFVYKTVSQISFKLFCLAVKRLLSGFREVMRLISVDQAKTELITTFLGRNCRMDFMKGACLQIQKSANIINVAGAFRRNGVKEISSGVKKWRTIFSII